MSRTRPELTTTSYAILGLLAIRPWSTYELARQMQRDLRFVWPRAESNLYAEPKKLIAHGLPQRTPNRAASADAPSTPSPQPASGPSPPGSGQRRPSHDGNRSRSSNCSSRPTARRSSCSNTSAISVTTRPLAGTQPRRSSARISTETSRFPTGRTSTSSQRDSSSRPLARRLLGRTELSRRFSTGRRPRNPRIVPRPSPRSKPRSPPERLDAVAMCASRKALPAGLTRG